MIQCCSNGMESFFTPFQGHPVYGRPLKLIYLVGVGHMPIVKTLDPVGRVAPVRFGVLFFRLPNNGKIVEG